MEAWGQRRGLETLGLALPACVLQSWGGAELFLLSNTSLPATPQAAWEAARPNLEEG